MSWAGRTIGRERAQQRKTAAGSLCGGGLEAGRRAGSGGGATAETARQLQAGRTAVKPRGTSTRRAWCCEDADGEGAEGAPRHLGQAGGRLGWAAGHVTRQVATSFTAGAAAARAHRACACAGACRGRSPPERTTRDPEQLASAHGRAEHGMRRFKCRTLTLVTCDSCPRRRSLPMAAPLCVTLRRTAALFWPWLRSACGRHPTFWKSPGPIERRCTSRLCLHVHVRTYM